MLFYLVGPDIAFNKPAEASSAYAGNKEMYGPQYVNNGKADCPNPSGPIAVTKENQKNEYFKVDLRGSFHIETVEIINRTGKCLYSNLIMNRLITRKEVFVLLLMNATQSPVTHYPFLLNSYALDILFILNMLSTVIK